jgi:hypothetical protein
MVFVSEVWAVFTMAEAVLLSAPTMTLNLGSVLPVLLLSSFSAVFMGALV